MLEYDRKDDMKEMWDIREAFLENISWKVRCAPLQEWLQQTLTILSIPEGIFRDSYISGFLKDEDNVFRLMAYIADTCAPEDEEEESEDEESEEKCAMCNETKIGIWFYNATPTKNSPVCEECRCT